MEAYFLRGFLLVCLLISTATAFGTIDRSSWSDSTYYFVSLNYTWTIGTIGYAHHSVQSSPFSATGTSLESAKWYLRMSVNSRYVGYYSYYNNIYIGFNSEGAHDDIRATYTITIFDLEGTKLLSAVQSASIVFKKGNEQVWDDKNLYDRITKGVVNDTVIVKCSIKMANDYRSVSSENPKYNFDVPACDFNEQTTKLILKDMEYSNTFFMVDSELVSVPRSLLASKSIEFDRLFNASKKTNEEPIKIALENIDRDTLEFILQFAYTGESVIPDELEIKLLEASRKYGLKTLMVSAEKALSTKVTTANALDMLDLAAKHEADGLKNYILDFIRANSLSMSVQDWKAMVEKMSAKQCELVAKKKCE